MSTPRSTDYSPDPLAADLAVGDLIDVDIQAVAPGGHCVGRWNGRVVFVRHTLPGERVRARVSQVRPRYAEADAVQIHTPSPDRVSPACGYAGVCGGCDWQHATPQAQRRAKAAVVIEQLRRLGGLPDGHDIGGLRLDGLTVEPLPGPDRGLGWRTRMQYAVDAQGRAGLRPHHGHDVIAVGHCPLEHPAIAELGIGSRRWSGVRRVEAVVSSTGERLLALTGRPDPLPDLPAGVSLLVDGQVARGRSRVLEQAPGGAARVTGTGFWQVHPAAPATLVAAVLDQVAPRPGERIADLYAGVGLFSLSLAPAVGPGGAVLHVEADPQAVRDARRTLHGLPQVQIIGGRVEHVLRGVGPLDAVLLDPPRAGASAWVWSAVVDAAPTRICYVACDPASLGRDTARLTSLGYRLDRLVAFDLFPNTRHVECVARFVPA